MRLLDAQPVHSKWPSLDQVSCNGTRGELNCAERGAAAVRPSGPHELDSRNCLIPSHGTLTQLSHCAHRRLSAGNWGSAIAKVIGINTKKAFFFQDEVPMYVFEERFQGRLLHDLINEQNENPKYLPGIQLPPNIRAESDIRRVVSGAHVLVFVMPHQFIKALCTEIQGHILPGAKAISLVKGFDCENNQINLMSEFIRKTLNIECASLSGANVAEGVAAEQFRSVGKREGRRVASVASAAGFSRRVYLCVSIPVFPPLL